MLKPVRLSRLGAASAIVDGQGRPTALFIRYFNDLLQQLEATINGVIAAQIAAEEAQAQALAALEQALDALTEAVAASSAAAVAQDAAAEAQETADTKLGETQANALYVRQDGTPDWTAPTGTSDRGTFASYTAPVISATPTQAEVQAVADATQVVSRHLAALVGDLLTIEALSG